MEGLETRPKGSSPIPKPAIELWSSRYRLWFIHGIAFDITEQKRVEGALEEQRNVLSLILDTVSALIVVLDPEGRILRFNRASEQTASYSFEEVAGKRVWELSPGPEDRDGFQAAFEQSRRGRIAANYESHWITKEGGRRLIAWSTTVLPNGDGSVRYVIATGIDITERRRLEGCVIEISGRERDCYETLLIDRDRYQRSFRIDDEAGIE